MSYLIKLLMNSSMLAIISIALGCSQVEQTKKTNPADQIIQSKTNPTTNVTEDSLLSKKAYQARLTRWLHPYKIDIQQGNVISTDMLEKLHLGMTKQQVKFLLGTSLMSESPAKNQWLYVFNDSKGGTIHSDQKLILTFNEDEMLSDIHEEKEVS
ncbi:MAG: outer membrane protein assembly factor BamE [Gammaproteobacteria bacterium]|nr:outer membrane protein assembly factor BamE [Gammaproteobacteria bacterium]